MSGPAPLVSRAVMSRVGEVYRVSFMEVAKPVEGEERHYLRAAVTLNIADVLSLHTLLSRVIQGLVDPGEIELEASDG